MAMSMSSVKAGTCVSKPKSPDEPTSTPESPTGLRRRASRIRRAVSRSVTPPIVASWMWRNLHPETGAKPTAKGSHVKINGGDGRETDRAARKSSAGVTEGGGDLLHPLAVDPE